MHIKDILIIILIFMVVLFWVKNDSDDEYDPEGVVIEYNCGSLDEYDTVPVEVVQECIDRGLLKNKS